jgi:phosphohistidine phosphatase
MKTIYLVRHAKAAKEPQQDDEKRLLLAQGVREAKAMAKRVRSAGVKPELIMASPAMRAAETANIFASELGYDENAILYKKELYEADRETLHKLIHKTDTAHDTVMLFGHNPALQDLAHELAQQEIELSPGSVIGISFSVAHWRNIAKGDGILQLFYSPDNLADNNKKITRQKLCKQLKKALHNVFQACDGQVAEKISSKTKRAAKKLAQKFIGYFDK